jgi:SAM-dependent methyltransferase
MSDDDTREQNRAGWDAVAEAWARPDDAFEAFARPVTDWILYEARLQPGHRVLELACGPGALGVEAAQRVGPAGHVLLSDVSEGMIEQARRRAEAAGVTNVDFKVLDAEWIDAPAASFDAIVCRWGLMFPADPEAALRECRRVLRPNARLATSAWDTEERNPWMTIMGAELYEQGLVGEPEPDAPGPMRFARPPGRLRDLLQGAGFQDVELEALDLLVDLPSFDVYWESQSQRSFRTRKALELTDDRGRAAFRAGVERRAEPFRQSDGTLRFPVRPLVAAGTA